MQPAVLSGGAAHGKAMAAQPGTWEVLDEGTSEKPEGTCQSRLPKTLIGLSQGSH